MEQSKSFTDEFVEIVFNDGQPPAPSKKRRWLWPVLGIATLLLAVGVLFLFLFTPQGQASPEALAQTYANAMMKDRVGQVYRLFPSAIARRMSGTRQALVEELDEFCYAYGQTDGYTLLSVTEYEPQLRQSFSTILNTEITDYRHITLSMTIDGRDRHLHLDVLKIKEKWYLAEVWNDDVLIGNGFALPEEAVDAYMASFTANSTEGMSLALAPSLTEAAVAKQYGLRQMLGEVDDFYAAGKSGHPVSYSHIQTKSYSAYQTQSMAEVLGAEPQAYRAYYYDACVGDTVYTLVVDLVQVNDRWGITRVWDYHKEYMI